MSQPAENSALINAARALYQWFHGAEPEQEHLLAVRDFIGSPITIEELRYFGDRLRQNDAFIAAQTPLVERWHTRMESGGELCEEEAQELIKQLFDGFDHALLFDHDVRASTTLVERGRISDTDTRIPGNMPCWTLHLTVRGNALFMSDGMEQQVQPGDMMLFRPEAEYHYGLHPQAEHWEHYWALFQPRGHWAELLNWHRLDSNILLLSLPDTESAATIEHLFNELQAMGEDASPFQSELKYNKLEELLIRARSYLATESQVTIDARIQRACDFMQARLASKFNVNDVALACNLSPSRLAHLFKQEMGIGAKSWINNQRLQKARMLLLESNDSVRHIGAQVGYEDAAHFTRHFRKNVGCSPRQFRQSFGSPGHTLTS